MGTEAEAALRAAQQLSKFRDGHKYVRVTMNPDGENGPYSVCHHRYTDNSGISGREKMHPGLPRYTFEFTENGPVPFRG